MTEIPPRPGTFARVDGEKEGLGRARMKGFTLLELAIVLIVVGLLMPFFLRMVEIGHNRDRFAVTRDNIKEIRQAMAQYYARYGRYPCPAADESLSGPAGPQPEKCFAPDPAGMAGLQKAGLAFSEGAHKQKVVEGAVPYRSLNIKKAAVYDGWGRPFAYAVSSNLTVSGASQAGQIGMLDGSGASLTDPDGSVFWVLVSHGPDASCDAGSLDSENCDRDGVFIDADLSSGGEKPFDDIVFYRTWADLPDSPGAQYCRLAETGDGERDRLFQEGMIVQVCGKTATDFTGDPKCTFLVCRDGRLTAGVVAVGSASGQN